MRIVLWIPSTVKEVIILKKKMNVEEFCAKKSVERKRRRPMTGEVRVRNIREFDFGDMEKTMGPLSENEVKMLGYVLRKYNPITFCQMLRLDALRLMVNSEFRSLVFPEYLYNEEDWVKELLLWVTSAEKKEFLGKVMKYAAEWCYPHHFDNEVAKYLVFIGPVECRDIALNIYENYIDIDMSKSRLYDSLACFMSSLQFSITVDKIEKDIDLSPFETDILKAGISNIERNFDKFKESLLGATIAGVLNEKLIGLMKKAKVDDWHDINVTDLYGFVSQTQLHSRLIVNLDRQEETRTLGKICEYTEVQLRTFRNIGAGCTQELKRILGHLGLSLKRDT